MESLLHQRRIALWELVLQHYKVPKARQDALDTLIRQGEEIPPKLGKPSK